MITPEMPKRVLFVVNGIMTDPNAHDAWTDTAERWGVTNLPDHHRVVKYEVWSGPLTRRLTNAGHAAALEREVREYVRAGWTVDVAAHSNGAVIALLAGMRSERVGWFGSRPAGLWVPTADPCPIDTLTLLSPACEPDFEANGINTALASRFVRRVRVCMAGADRALGAARVSRALLGWAGLGYQSLGLDGPRNVREPAGVSIVSEPAFGHSGWFAGDPDSLGTPFARTLRMLT